MPRVHPIDRTEEEPDKAGAGGPPRPSDPERGSYYYDDAHGYEDFDPENEPEDDDEDLNEDI